MNQVKRAIIMAAGKGKRMQPITLKTPKPLVKVNGVCMIESIINALHKNNINEIYVVVGYLKEQFEYLETKYCHLKLIINPYFNKCNNISSLYVARNYIENSIIIDGDQIINNSSILTSEFTSSGYNCVWNEQETNEWLLSVNNDIVTGCNREGGKKGWQLFSISRWTSEDGKKLKKHLEIEFEQNKNTQIYWDDIALFCYPQEYQLRIKKMNKGDVIEIDNITELITLDKNYKKYLDGDY